jgi:hypothetical protein
MLEVSKGPIRDMMMSLPDGVAESLDFEVWGKKFCELMVSGSILVFSL